MRNLILEGTDPDLAKINEKPSTRKVELEGH